ncbi:cilia- and flagella-associated protein 161 [Lampris incognitus]|uniref:cilia- and flagella-associated protein 161 n=1 Tax=Lampris incognitus TaxID=2546036 RepID=UPI0024B48EC2|nr:cilia- and flagella-associated protein 161 [Lampris incognitus]
MAQFGSYCPSVRVGNWSEDAVLEEEALRDFLERRARGELTGQRRDLLRRGALQQVNLSVSKDGGLHFGDVVMLLNMGGQNREISAIGINVDIGNLTETPEPVIKAPCGVSAGRSVEPCARTAFIITSVDGSPEGSALHYEQSFALKTTSGFSGGLYLTSDLRTFQKCAKKSRLQEVSLDEASSFMSWWKVVHFDPQERIESEGVPVPANTEVLVTHCKTNQALAVLGDQVLWTMCGQEYEVTAHTFLDSHKAERDNNHWIFSTSDPAVAGFSPSGWVLPQWLDSPPAAGFSPSGWVLPQWLDSPPAAGFSPSYWVLPQWLDSPPAAGFSPSGWVLPQWLDSPPVAGFSPSCWVLPQWLDSPPAAGFSPSGWVLPQWLGSR